MIKLLNLIKEINQQYPPNHEQECRTTSGDLIDIEGRILGASTLQVTVHTYWKKYLQENLPGHIYSRIEFI